MPSEKPALNRKEQWNNLERICDLLYVKPDSSQDLERMQVPGETHHYNIYTGSLTPSFVYVPQHEEIFFRLILKAAKTTDLSELDLKLSRF